MYFCHDTLGTNFVKRQTVDTFSAARTFLEVLGIWQKPLSEEVKARIKYAKYHEVRILKALRAGEDPNAGVETPPALTPSIPATMDMDDPEVKQLMQPSVEDVSDHDLRAIPPAAPSMMLHHHHQQPPQHETGGDVSPLDEADQQQHDGYFPPAAAPIVPSVPTFAPDSHPSPMAPTHLEPQNFYSAPAPSSLPSTSPSFSAGPSIPPSFSPQQPYSPQPPQQPYSPQPPPPSAFSPVNVVPQPQAPPYRTPQPTIPMFNQPVAAANISSTAYKTDDAAVAAAQKHAKWAISALNFDDVDTAVNELRIALRSLGG
jgi:vacuolar protein sorting-associated protein VTA1